MSSSDLPFPLFSKSFRGLLRKPHTQARAALVLSFTQASEAKYFHLFVSGSVQKSKPQFKEVKLLLCSFKDMFVTILK